MPCSCELQGSSGNAAQILWFWPHSQDHPDSNIRSPFIKPSGWAPTSLHLVSRAEPCGSGGGGDPIVVPTHECHIWPNKGWMGTLALQLILPKLQLLCTAGFRLCTRLGPVACFLRPRPTLKVPRRACRPFPSCLPGPPPPDFHGNTGRQALFTQVPYMHSSQHEVTGFCFTKRADVSSSAKDTRESRGNFLNWKSLTFPCLHWNNSPNSIQSMIRGEVIPKFPSTLPKRFTNTSELLWGAGLGQGAFTQVIRADPDLTACWVHETMVPQNWRPLWRNDTIVET